jgi:CRISPR-associated protein Cas1
VNKNIRPPRPRALVLSKRANVFYIEHARVILMDDRIVYLTQDGGDIEQFFNIPERNTSMLLLGKGTSITDAAVRRLAESNVVVGFCGSGGSPIFGAVDLAFLAPQSEYRPTEYMQAWARMWLSEERRIAASRTLLLERLELTRRAWSQNPDLLDCGIGLSPAHAEAFELAVRNALTPTDMLLAEARWAQRLYAELARAWKIEFVREEGARRHESTADVVNGFLDHGNYIAYGYAAVALCGLGISYSFPLLHGKTRRGALVFDVADLVKDAYVMPLAFASAQRGDAQRDFRTALIETFQERNVLDYLFTFLTDICAQL